MVVRVASWKYSAIILAMSYSQRKRFMQETEYVPSTATAETWTELAEKATVFGNKLLREYAEKKKADWEEMERNQEFVEAWGGETY